MRTLKLTLAYDGTNYVGWQRQVNGLSVQQVVEEACASLVGGQPPTVVGAGRTDAGVHALGQVATVNLESDVPASGVQRALNTRLPDDIRVVGAVDAPAGFHARYHAKAKVYRYRMATTPVVSPFERWFVWHAPEPRDLGAMQQAALSLIGRHDFVSFQARGAAVLNTVRTIHRLTLEPREGEVVIDVEGDGFLRHMVRAIVGTLAEVGAGLRPVDSMAGVLEARDRQAAGKTAPAAGLTLMAIKY